MRRLLLPAAALVVLWFASTARAHITVLPTYLEEGKRTTLVFAAPNEHPPHAMTDMTVTFSRGVELSAMTPPRGWHVTVVPANARWSGGRAGPGTVLQFRIDARTENAPGATTVYAVQRYDDGRTVRWEIPFLITPPSNSPAEHLWPAVIAAVVGFVVIVGGLIYIRRRRPA